MKITIEDAVKAYGIENQIGCVRKLLQNGFTAAEAFDYLPIIDDLKKISEDFDKVRKETAIRLGEDKGNGNFQVKPENLNQFNKEMNEVTSKKVNVTDVKIDLNKHPEFKIATDDLPILKLFISFNKEKQTEEKVK